MRQREAGERPWVFANQLLGKVNKKHFNELGLSAEFSNELSFDCHVALDSAVTGLLSGMAAFDTEMDALLAEPATQQWQSQGRHTQAEVWREKDCLAAALLGEVA